MFPMAKLIDFVFPPRCIVTGDIVDQQGMLSPQAWGELNFITDPLCHRCGLPFDFSTDEVQEGNVCGVCLRNPPVFDKARAALIYDDASRDIILGFKHADQTEFVPSFLPWLQRAGGDILNKADFFVPVPLHRWRLLRRRYNQSGLIASYLFRETHIPVLLDALTRVRATQTQGHLKPDQRKQNVRRAFSINPKIVEKIKNKNIVLIDDVYTTGATASECTKILLKNGASSVNILTLARVVKASQVL